MTTPSAMWPPTPRQSAKMIHSRIIVTIGHASWKVTGEVGTGSLIEDESVTPPASWLTQCPLL